MNFFEWVWIPSSRSADEAGIQHLRFSVDEATYIQHHLSFYFLIGCPQSTDVLEDVGGVSRIRGHVCVIHVHSYLEL